PGVLARHLTPGGRRKRTTAGGARPAPACHHAEDARALPAGHAPHPYAPDRHPHAPHPYAPRVRTRPRAAARTSPADGPHRTRPPPGSVPGPGARPGRHRRTARTSPARGPDVTGARPGRHRRASRAGTRDHRGMDVTLHLAQDPEADALLGRSPLAALIGM